LGQYRGAIDILEELRAKVPWNLSKALAGERRTSRHTEVSHIDMLSDQFFLP
jgi:hypothetical protein